MKSKYAKMKFILTNKIIKLRWIVMEYRSINIINTSEVKSYEPYNIIKDYKENTCRLGEKEYQIKQVFEKDSNLVLFALRCLLGAVLILPTKCLELLTNKKFTWVSNLFIRKELYIAIDQNEKITIKPTSEIIAVKPTKTEIKPKDYFVQALNDGKYTIDGVEVQIPAASKPIKVTRYHAVPLECKIEKLKEDIPSFVETPAKFVYEDKSTEEAINVRNGMAKLALNFANEHHAGGGPGFHKDSETGLFVYDCDSAMAQEESLSQRTTIMASLTQLPHVTEKDKGKGKKMVRSYYTDAPGSNKKVGFDSRDVAYISDNHLFGVQHNNQMYGSAYVNEPQAVTFITSAAAYYGGLDIIDCSVGSIVYNDAKQRIEAHLYASAVKAAELKKKDPNASVELILGAFGCGAFVPKDVASANEYRAMIATIYKDLLPKFDGFFDQVTFAVPTLGKTDKNHKNVLNYEIFKNVIMATA